MPDNSCLSGNNWFDIATSLLDHHQAIVLASVVAVKGSAPCYVGSRMLISTDCIDGTIGGGSLEFEVMRQARKEIREFNNSSDKWVRRLMDIALGPDTGQCCGGFVKVLIEVLGHREQKFLGNIDRKESAVFHPFETGRPLMIWRVAETLSSPNHSKIDGLVMPIADIQQPIFLYGAGHIGRTLVPMLEGLGFDLYWIDINEQRFPKTIPKWVTRVIAKDPSLIASRAPTDTIHLVITHSHALDQMVCHSVLARQAFARLGLIGSKTKKNRFKTRLKATGISTASLDRLICPIGLEAVTGKTPQLVAISIAAQIATWRVEKNTPADLTDNSQNMI